MEQTRTFEWAPVQYFETILIHGGLEPGATPFLRAAASGDLPVMKLLLAYGADPSITTLDKTTPLMVASGVGWTQGVTQENSESETAEAVQFLLDLGMD